MELKHQTNFAELKMKLDNAACGGQLSLHELPTLKETLAEMNSELCKLKSAIRASNQSCVKFK